MLKVNEANLGEEAKSPLLGSLRMSLTELLLFAGSSLKDFNWKYRETLEKRRKEKLKEINSEVDLDGRSVGRGNSAAGLLGRQGGEWTNSGK